MQKKIIAVAVAGLSTAAFAQTNVTIYGVADVSAQGYTMSEGKALNSALNTGSPASGSVFGMQSNSSLLGFKGTEDLGNGLKALFQAESGVNFTGTNESNSSAGSQGISSNANLLGGLRDTFVALDSKYGMLKGGYNSVPFRASLTSFDVMPGATGSGQIEKIMGTMRFSTQAIGEGVTNTAYSFGSSFRATSIAYAMPTLYGFNGSIAYTGSNNNGTNNETTVSTATSTSQATQTPNSAMGFNLGWTGYGVNVQGAFQQTKYNLTGDANISPVNAYTSYLVGTSYTGLPGLKVSVVYARNSLGTNAEDGDAAAKISNNQLFTGASYRMGNWEPRISAVWNSDVSGAGNLSQTGARQWTANLGYYLSKRTQVYGVIANLNNSANQNYTLGMQQNRMVPTGGQNLFTYGMGVRTTF
jgi:predicted porin